jgi:hypothetical protein
MTAPSHVGILLPPPGFGGLESILGEGTIVLGEGTILMLGEGVDVVLETGE